MRTLSNPDNRLERLIEETGDLTRVLAPVANPLARGFTGMADTFEALSRDPEALRDTIERSPGTLQTGIETLPDTRPFLIRLAGISDEVQGTARELRASLPAVNRALAAGTPVLRRRRSSPRTSRAACAPCATSPSRRRPTSRWPA